MASFITAGNATNGLQVSSDNTGILELRTGTGSGTTAVTFSTGQRATFPSTISVGNTTPATTGAGITFPAAQSASSDANTLDDYEEGTWTPTLTGDGGGSGQTYTVQAGTYVKIGQQVTVSFYINLSNKGTITGSAIIGNLPFVAINSNSNIWGGALALWLNLATNQNLVGGYVNSGTAAFYLWGGTTTASTPPALTTTAIGNTTRFWGSVTYLTT